MARRRKNANQPAPRAEPKQPQPMRAKPSRPPQLEDLPDGVLLTVFSFLAAHDSLPKVVQLLGPVCRRFRELAWSPALLGEQLDPKHPSAFVRGACEKMGPAIRRLCLSGLPQLTEDDAHDMIAAAAEATHLSAAFLLPPPTRGEGWRGPATFRTLGPHPRLVHLNLSGVTVFEHALRALAASCAPSLRALFLSATLVRTRGGARYAEGAPEPTSPCAALTGIHFPRLATLDLSHSVVEPEHAADLVARCPALTRLFVACTREPRGPELRWADFRRLRAAPEGPLRAALEALARPNLAVVSRDFFAELRGAAEERDRDWLRRKVHEAAALATGPLAAGLDAVDAEGLTPFLRLVLDGSFQAAKCLQQAAGRPLALAPPRDGGQRSQPDPWTAPYPMEAIEDAPRAQWRPAGRTPGALHKLLRERPFAGFVEAAEALLRLGADPFAEDERGCSAFEALLSGGWPAAEKLRAVRALAEGCEAFARREHGALFFLAGEGGADDGELAALLCSRGADPSARDHNDDTPIHVAAARNRPAVARALAAAAGAGANARNRAQQSPLYVAFEAGHLTVVRALLDAGASAQGAGPGGESVAHLAIRRGDDTALLFIEREDFPVDAASETAGTPLHAAVRAGLPRVVEALLRRGADPNVRFACFLASARGGAGDTPLHLALRLEQRDCARLLIECPRAGMELRGEDGATPLHVAIAHNDPELVAALVARGADPSATVNGGATTALQAAIQAGPAAPALVAALLSAPEAPLEARDALALAASRGLAGVVEALLAAGADVNARGEDGATALHAAAARGQAAAVRALLRAPARARREGREEVEVDARDEGGATPLMAAARGGDPDVLEALVARGADARLRDGRGATALDHATAALRASTPEGFRRAFAVLLRA